jgi:hypothetical protein
LPERLAQHSRSALVRWDAPPAEWNAALLAAGDAGEWASVAEWLDTPAQRVLAS